MARWGAVGLAVVALACNEAPHDGLRTTFPDATDPCSTDLCPDGSVIGPDATVPELDPADALAKYCRELDEIWVRKAVRCLGGTERAWSELEGLYECRDLVSALRAGHLAFDPVAGAGCLAGYEQLSCDQQFGSAPGPLPECGHVTRGLLPEGAPCEGPIECGEALACDDWPGISGSCTRTCVPFRPLPIGAACDQEHLSPTYCESGHCSADQVCTARLVLGDPCSADCWRCCTGGTYCNSQNGRCEAALPEGSRCASSSHELQCAGYDVGCPRETPDATCTRLRRIGETCQAGKHECVFNYPCAVQPDGSFICTLLPSLGQPCNEHQLEPLYCLDGRCSNALGPGTCIPRTAIGEPCTSHDECQDFVCDQGICIRWFSCP